MTRPGGVLKTSRTQLAILLQILRSRFAQYLPHCQRTSAFLLDTPARTTLVRGAGKNFAPPAANTALQRLGDGRAKQVAARLSPRENASASSLSIPCLRLWTRH